MKVFSQYVVSWRGETNQVVKLRLFDTYVRSVTLKRRQNQREVVWVDPDDAELWVVGVVSGHIFEDLQELVAIWEQQCRGI